MNETDFQNGFILGMSAGGSSIAEVDLPFTEDGKGNVIFEKDIYYNKTKSVKALETNLNKALKDLSNQSTKIENQSTELEKHIEEAEDFLVEVQDRLDGLEKIVGDSASYELYKRAGLDETEYPYIFVAVSPNGIGEVYFMQSPLEVDNRDYDSPSMVGVYIPAPYRYIPNGSVTGDGTTIEGVIEIFNANTSPLGGSSYRGEKDMYNGRYYYTNYELETPAEAGNWSVFNALSLQKEVENLKLRLSDENIGKVIDSRHTQSDFTQEDPAAKDYIKNRPRIRQDYVILSDIENGYNYGIQMMNGNLITSPIPIGTRVTTLPIKTTYYRGDFLDTTGMVVSVYGEDGSVGETNKYTSYYLDNPFDTVGRAAVTMVSDLFGTEYKASFAVNVIEFDPEAVLIDFEYTTNDDGTYTITGWKETLNGEPSTEFIVPNNSLIRI